MEERVPTEAEWMLFGLIDKFGGYWIRQEGIKVLKNASNENYRPMRPLDGTKVME